MMIDYHCHLLPGLDDGAVDRDQSLAMAKSLAEFGFREVCCTPHCIHRQYEISPVEVRDAVRNLQRVIDTAGIELLLHPGMEYYLDDGFETFAANLLPLGESRLVLCEAPQQVRPEAIVAMLELIVVQGYIPLVAHPERTESIYKLLTVEQDAIIEPSGVAEEAAPGPTPDKPRSFLQRLFVARSPKSVVDGLDNSMNSPPAELPESCLFQANLGSFTGFYGPGTQRRAYELLQRGVYGCFASDLHDDKSAPAILEPAREKLEYNPALQRLGSFVPPKGAGGNPQMGFW